jgi:hypothetical protein
MVKEMQNSPMASEEEVSTESQELQEETQETQEQGVTEDDFTPKTIEDGDEESPSPDSEEEAPSETGDDEVALDDLSLDDFKEEKKTGVQKRIDKLVAEKKALEDRLSKVEASADSKAKPEYSEAQLRQAMAKAMEENDPNLMWEIMDYRVKRERESALSEERKRQDEMALRQQRGALEWQSVIEEYSYLSEEDGPEMFGNSKKALNIKDPNSLLLKVATQLYKNPQYAERYQKDGGQRLAVSDAIKWILKKKTAKVTSKETEQLKRKLAKEKRKSSVSTGSAIKKEDQRPKSYGSQLDDYIEERKAELAKARGGL